MTITSSRHDNQTSLFFLISLLLSKRSTYGGKNITICSSYSNQLIISRIFTENYVPKGHEQSIDSDLRALAGLKDTKLKSIYVLFSRCKIKCLILINHFRVARISSLKQIFMWSIYNIQTYTAVKPCSAVWRQAKRSLKTQLAGTSLSERRICFNDIQLLLHSFTAPCLNEKCEMQCCMR